MDSDSSKSPSDVMLEAKHDINISGGLFVHNPSNPAEAWKELHDCAAVNAMHDSDILHNQRISLEDTQQATLTLLNDHLSTTAPDSPNILWTYGAAGAGKSPIALTIAKSTSDAGKLIGSFFFYHSDSTRNTITPFVPTLAVQLCRVFRQARRVIEQALEDDPLILKKAARAQASVLIADPLKRILAQGTPNPSDLRPLVVLVDGLDQCRNSDRQLEIINILLELVTELNTPRHSRLKVAIFSRQEEWLRDHFTPHERAGRVRSIALNDELNLFSGGDVGKRPNHSANEATKGLPERGSPGPTAPGLKAASGSLPTKLPEIVPIEPTSSVGDPGTGGPSEIERRLAFAEMLFKARQTKVDELNDDDVIIMVMGPTGAGKSTFISIAGALDEGTIDIGHSCRSCTSEISMYRISCPLLLHKDIVLVDTPGFEDTNISDKDILRLVADWLEARYKARITVSGILYFHRISDNRLGGTPLKNLRMFQKLCGEESLKKVTLVTTMWDMIDSEELGLMRLEELSRDPRAWKGMIDLGSEVRRFGLTFRSALEILRRTTDPLKEEYDRALRADLRAGLTLLQHPVTPKSTKAKKVDKKRRVQADAAQKGVLGSPLRLQEEMVDEGKELPDTEAGRFVFSKIHELVEKRVAVLDRLKEEIELAGEDGIPEAVLYSLRRELEDLQREFDVAQRELASLRITIGERLARWMKAGRSIGGLTNLLKKFGRR